MRAVVGGEDSGTSSCCSRTSSIGDGCRVSPHPLWAFPWCRPTQRLGTWSLHESCLRGRPEALEGRATTSPVAATTVCLWGYAVSASVSDRVARMRFGAWCRPLDSEVEIVTEAEPADAPVRNRRLL